VGLRRFGKWEVLNVSVYACANQPGRSAGYPPIDAVTLERAGVAVCIGDAVRSMPAIVDSIERGLSAAFAQMVPDEKDRIIHPVAGTINRMGTVPLEQIRMAGQSRDTY
jgi:hypothetical protein